MISLDTDWRFLHWCTTYYLTPLPSNNTSRCQHVQSTHLHPDDDDVVVEVRPLAELLVPVHPFNGELLLFGLLHLSTHGTHNRLSTHSRQPEPVNTRQTTWQHGTDHLSTWNRLSVCTGSAGSPGCPSHRLGGRTPAAGSRADSGPPRWCVSRRQCPRIGKFGWETTP